MNNAYIWGNALPFAVFVISVGLLLISLRKKWLVEPAPTEQPADTVENVLPVERSSIRERIKIFVSKHRWELILGIAIGAILLFALVFAPPRLNGSIATQPSSPGRPFYNLRWIRAFLHIHYDTIWVWSGASFSIICLVLLVWAYLKRSGLGAQFLVLCTSLNLAVIGQWLLHAEAYRTSAKILYLSAILGFGLWAWTARNRLVKDLESKPFPRIAEVLLILGLLLLTSFNRLYALRTIPYGIEGDEAKWTSEAVNLGIRGAPDSSGEYHRDALPVSYYLQLPLHRLLGPSLFAARLTVVLLSILGTLIFYWLLRQIASIPIAALATFLLSISIFDISASRLANVESFVKIWPILGLALLALAVRMRRWQIYGLSGLAIALGMLTYDTVWPVFGAALIIAIIELARQKDNWRASMSAIAALIAPTLLTLPVIIPYLASRMPYYEFDNKGLHRETAATLSQYLGNVIYTWFVSLKSDFLYNRPGPLLNAILLPMLVLGCVAALPLIKQKVSYWTLLWAGLVIFPIPVLANSAMGRIYYPALPAVYTLVALGIFFLWREIDRFFGPNLRPLLIAVTLVPLVWLPLANLFIYFNEVSDGEDRLMRREIGEMAAQAADADTLILLPATPGLNTPLNNEYQMLELYMMQKIPPSKIASAYRYITPEELLSSIKGEAAYHQKIEIIFDKTETETITKTLQVCYPQGALTEGKYFSRYRLSDIASQSMNCSFATLNIELAADNNLNWSLSDGSTQKLEILCEVRQKDFKWLETEDQYMGYGWQAEIEFAPGWSGTGFAMDNYGSGLLPLEIFTERSQESYIWVRYFVRSLDENTAFLNVNNRSYPFAKINATDLNNWKWEKIGPVQLDAGSELSISRNYIGDPQRFMAFFIDSLVITPDAEFSPETDLWKDVSPKKFSFDQPQSSGTVQLDLPMGYYRCRLSMESDVPVVDTLGNPSPYLESNTVEFNIK